MCAINVKFLKICHSLCLCRVNELEWIGFSPIRNRGWPSWSSGWDSIQDVAQPAVGNHRFNYSTICLQWIFDWEEGHRCRLTRTDLKEINYSFYLACKGLKLYRCFSVDRRWICSIFTLQAHLMWGSAHMLTLGYSNFSSCFPYCISSLITCIL